MVATRRGKTRSTSGTLYTAKNLARTLQKKRKAASKKTTSARVTTSRATTRRTTTSAPRRATTSRATTSRATTRRATTSAPRRAAAPSAARRALATGRGTFVRRTGSRSASLAGMFAAMRARGDYDENRARGLRGRR